MVSLDGANTTPLGALDQPCTHTEKAVVLEPGEVTLLYTDGITEARSPEGTFLGTARLDEILRALPEPVTPASAVEAVAHAVDQFAGPAAAADDQTLLALARRGLRDGQ